MIVVIWCNGLPIGPNGPVPPNHRFQVLDADGDGKTDKPGEVVRLPIP